MTGQYRKRGSTGEAGPVDYGPDPSFDPGGSPDELAQSVASTSQKKSLEDIPPPASGRAAPAKPMYQAFPVSFVGCGGSSTTSQKKSLEDIPPPASAGGGQGGGVDRAPLGERIDRVYTWLAGNADYFVTVKNVAPNALAASLVAVLNQQLDLLKLQQGGGRAHELAELLGIVDEDSELDDDLARGPG